MLNRDIVVIGASAGGVEVLARLVRTLPSDLPAALFVSVHFPAYEVSVLPSILTRAGSLPAKHPQHGEAIERGRIYVAPPDYHLLVQQDYICLSRGPRENGHRPAIDTLFRSASRAYGQRVVGVILSGALDDGTAGLAMIKSRGGLAIVQDPNEALFDGMPRSAIENVAVDHILRLIDIASLLMEKADDPIEENVALARRMATQAQQQNRLLSEAQFNERAQESAQHAALIREVIYQQSEITERNDGKNLTQERSPDRD